MEKGESDSNLCVKCRGRGWCKRECKILSKLKTSLPKIKEHFSGSSPPEVFVGHVSYPKVFSGILSPVEFGDTSSFSFPEQWLDKNLSIEQILDLRGRMIYSRTKQDVRLNKRFNEVMQELSLSSQPVSTEFFLKKAPTLKFEASRYFQIMANPAPIKRIVLQENPKVDRKVDYLTSDYDVKATDAISELYSSNIQTSHLQKLFSIGLLGVKIKRRMVPTRWSITAVDDILGKKLLEKIRYFKELQEIQLFHYDYNGNHFEVLFLPGNFEFEVIEVSLKGNMWAESQIGEGKDYFMQDSESFFGRKKYAENVTGGYYADRIAVCEYLTKIQRQSSVLVLHEERPEYYAPLGVGIIRESLRKAFQQQPERPQTMQEAFSLMSSRLKIPFAEFLSRSSLLKNYGKQKKLPF